MTVSYNLASKQIIYFISTTVPPKKKVNRKKLPDLCESVEERARETLATTTLIQGILTGKDACAAMLDVKSSGQLWHKHLTAMIQAGIKTFKH